MAVKERFVFDDAGYRWTFYRCTHCPN